MVPIKASKQGKQSSELRNKTNVCASDVSATSDDKTMQGMSCNQWWQNHASDVMQPVMTKPQLQAPVYAIIPLVIATTYTRSQKAVS